MTPTPLPPVDPAALPRRAALVVAATAPQWLGGCGGRR